MQTFFNVKGLNREAEDSLLKCLNFDVHSPYVYYSLGLIYIELGHFKRAIPLLEKFLEYLVYFFYFFFTLFIYHKK